MSKVVIYHNPRCSKSRQTLELLREQGVEPEIINYLEHPPSLKQIKELLQALNCSVREILRSNETDYKAQNLQDPVLNEQQLIKAITQYPKILQRPIVVKGKKAVIGRPPENVLSLL